MLPQPVLIIGTYNEEGTLNAMNAAWGGQVDVYKMGLITYEPVSHLADLETTSFLIIKCSISTIVRSHPESLLDSYPLVRIAVVDRPVHPPYRIRISTRSIRTE